MPELPIAPVMRVVKAAVGDSVLWTSEAKDHLVELAEQTITSVAEAASQRVLAEGRAKVQMHDLDGSEAPSHATENPSEDYAELKETYDDYILYVGMLEEGLKLANERLKEAGRTPVIPKGQYIPRRIIMIAGGKENRGTQVVRE